MMTINIALYARACNVDPASMLSHLQSDSFARQQFEEWKSEQKGRCND